MTQVNDALSGSKPSASADKSVGRLGRGSVANFGGAVLSAATNFGVTVAITRGMSRSDAGVFFSCTSLFLLAVAVGQLGTSTGLVYFLSRARTLGEPQLLMGYLRAARTPVIVASFLMGIVLVVFAPVIAGWTNPQHVEAATVYLRVLGAFTPFASIKTLNLSASRGMGTMRPTVMLEQIGRPLLQFILVSAVVLLHAIALLPYAWAVCFVLGAAGGNRLLKQKMEKSGPRTARPRPVTREFWTFTWPRAAANVAQIAIQRFDIVLVGAIAGAGPAAVYTASTRFLVLGQLGNRAVSMSAQPRLAEALARGRRSDVNHIYQTSTAWLMISTWPIYLMFAIVGGPLLEV
ncbi:MAG: oligosaccharide flippase family protein, partial [Lapillicoccus sp.]